MTDREWPCPPSETGSRKIESIKTIKDRNAIKRMHAEAQQRIDENFRAVLTGLLSVQVGVDLTDLGYRAVTRQAWHIARMAEEERLKP